MHGYRYIHISIPITPKSLYLSSLRLRIRHHCIFLWYLLLWYKQYLCPQPTESASFPFPPSCHPPTALLQSAPTPATWVAAVVVQVELYPPTTFVNPSSHYCSGKCEARAHVCVYACVRVCHVVVLCSRGRNEAYSDIERILYTLGCFNTGNRRIFTVKRGED